MKCILFQSIGNIEAVKKWNHDNNEVIRCKYRYNKDNFNLYQTQDQDTIQASRSGNYEQL